MLGGTSDCVPKCLNRDKGMSYLGKIGNGRSQEFERRLDWGVSHPGRNSHFYLNHFVGDEGVFVATRADIYISESRRSL